VEGRFDEVRAAALAAPDVLVAPDEAMLAGWHELFTASRGRMQVEWSRLLNPHSSMVHH
jgi:hypothetical protein